MWHKQTVVTLHTKIHMQGLFSILSQFILYYVIYFIRFPIYFKNVYFSWQSFRDSKRKHLCIQENLEYYILKHWMFNFRAIWNHFSSEFQLRCKYTQKPCKKPPETFHNNTWCRVASTGQLKHTVKCCAVLV